MNFNCDGGNTCQGKPDGQIRRFPIGNGNFLLCRKCYSNEIAWRESRNEKYNKLIFDLPEWEKLEIYEVK